MTPPDSVICTLFEGNYHYGVAALVNSLYKNGFYGDVYIGYRGDLPAWANDAKSNDKLNWEGAVTMLAAAKLCLHFLPVQTEWHLANYKPVFILDVQRCANTSIFYFDPDITIKCNWKFFEEWIGYGVAVVQEIISNNFSPAHPKRMQYLPVIERSNRKVERHLDHILNSGFCGVSLNDIEFLETWIDITNTAVQYFNFQPTYFIKDKNQSELFVAGDQDMMNIAAMCAQPAISDVGPEGMDFIPGGWLMSHATGQPKPWQVSFIKKVLKGEKISLAEKNYWAYVNGCIITHTRMQVKIKRLSIKIASFISRFYTKK